MTTPDQRPWLTTWGEVIASLRALGPDDEVWFGGRPSSPDDPCLVADGTEIVDDEPPAEAQQRGWPAVLGKDTLQEILDNLTQQVDDPDINLILHAVTYYADHDAFIVVT
jgi:hypothetical protein